MNMIVAADKNWGIGKDGEQLFYIPEDLKRFKALTGFGFLDYLTQTRLRAAEDLLVRTSLSIGDISADYTAHDVKNYSDGCKFAMVGTGNIERDIKRN